MEFSFLEKIIFIVAAIGAFAGLLYFAAKPIRLIKEGQKENKPRNNEQGERYSRVIKEVLFQTKVVGGRPVAGLMHMAVFIAFIGFAFETLNMLFEPFGFEYLHLLPGGVLDGFRSVMMVIAAIAAVSIFGLFLRRFVFVKYSPDPKSYESGLVAFFIFLLMVTYIDLYGTKLVDPKINWWLHILIIFIFPALILHSKHLHLILAPLNIYFKSFRLWDVPKMNLDFESAESEDDIQLGLERIEQIPWKLRLDFFSCVECKRCTDQCPAAQADLDLQPAEFIKAGRKALMQGKKEDSVIGNLISEKALGQCTSCMACENICPVGVEHSQVLFGAKAAQALAIGTGSVATEFFKVMTNHENPFSASRDVRTSLIKELNLPMFKKGKTEYALWLGCVWSYNPDFKKALQSTSNILDKAGISYGVLDGEKCCGHHSRKQGEEMQFQMFAEENSAILKELDVKKIITGCPHCLQSIKNEYPEYMKDHKLEIYHHSEILFNALNENKIKLNNNSASEQKITYHDPCFLGRYERVLEEPREVIEKTGASIIEMKLNREISYCCGGGAGGFTIEGKDEKRIDQVRKEHINDSGAGLLITACPECKMMLAGTVEETKDIGEYISDFVE